MSKLYYNSEGCVIAFFSEKSGLIFSKFFLGLRKFKIMRFETRKHSSSYSSKEKNLVKKETIQGLFSSLSPLLQKLLQRSNNNNGNNKPKVQIKQMMF